MHCEAAKIFNLIEERINNSAISGYFKPVGNQHYTLINHVLAPYTRSKLTHKFIEENCFIVKTTSILKPYNIYFSPKFYDFLRREIDSDENRKRNGTNYVNVR
jgi:hypothetical protein